LRKAFARREGQISFWIVADDGRSGSYPLGKRFAIVGRWFIIPLATLAWVEAEHFYMQERMPLSWSQILKPELPTVVFQRRTAERQRADLSANDSKV